MMIETKGLIIKEVKVGEGNKIFTVLTDKYGKIQVSAKGIRSYKSKLSGGCTCFGYSLFQLKEGKTMYSLIGADMIESFYDLRLNLVKLSYATYFCSLVNYVMNENENSESILRLTLNTLYYLMKNDEPSIAKPVFELRMLSELGFVFELKKCVNCGKSDNFISFSVNDGGVLCRECSSKANIKASVVNAMSYIQRADLKQIFSFSVDEETKSMLNIYSEKLIKYHVGTSVKALEYLKNIIS